MAFGFAANANSHSKCLSLVLPMAIFSFVSGVAAQDETAPTNLEDVCLSHPFVECTASVALLQMQVALNTSHTKADDCLEYTADQVKLSGSDADCTSYASCEASCCTQQGSKLYVDGTLAGYYCKDAYSLGDSCTADANCASGSCGDCGMNDYGSISCCVEEDYDDCLTYTADQVELSGSDADCTSYASCEASCCTQQGSKLYVDGTLAGYYCKDAYSLGDSCTADANCASGSCGDCGTNDYGSISCCV